MASSEDQVLKWLGGVTCPPNQPPLKLGQQIESFETDFANGWLFGNILVQYGVCESINTFTRKTNKESKCHNFYQVEDALRELKVNFDAKLIHNIMNEERGAALKLLNQIRISLDKHFSESDFSVTGLKKSVVDSKIKKVADLATKLPEIHQQYGVSGPSIKGKHFQKIEEKLLKFEVARANLEKKAEEDTLAETNMLKSIQQQKRQEAMKKLKENQQFMDDWEKTGKANWRKNRETRASEIARQEYFDNREILIYKDGLNRELVFNTSDMIKGVEEFQENLRKLGIEENITIKEAMKRQEEKKGIPPGQLQNFSYAATMNKIKETKNNNEFAGKERERRNRKMMVDQRKIQETLDSQKTEEQLIQKLLQKQHEEQQEAYIRWRNDQCREIKIQNKIKKAEHIEQQKLDRNVVIAQRMKDEADAVEADRVAHHLQEKLEIKKARREEKAKRRRVNVEIASEVIDLIMDVADEAFDFQVAHHSKPEDERLMDKGTWRRWMDIFTQGKKVSEQNIVIQKDEAAQDDGKDHDPLAQLLGNRETPMHPFQIVDNVKNEAIFNDFLQYLAMCGPLNLRLAAPDKWGNVQQIVKKEPSLRDRNIQLGFLDEIYVPKNIELGLFIEQLYPSGLSRDQMGLTKMNMSSQSMAKFQETFHSSNKMPKGAEGGMEVIVEDTEKDKMYDFPNYHTLKLCVIGRAFSGKKTQVQLINEKLGGKLTEFNMMDVLREALNFAKPPKEEVVDPKAKGGKGKPAQAEASASDLFVGKDTTLYKIIAEQLLQQIQITFGQETIPGKDVDLISLVSDDSLLVRLFIEKLKLTFDAATPDQKVQQQKMRDNLVKYKELEDELQEAIANEGSQELAAKDAKGKPAKGQKAVKSVSEIRAEMKALMSVDINGWILVDFPRTINQAKLLENVLNGYKSLTDAPKTFERQNFEIWSKFADPDVTKEHFGAEVQAQPSFFDGIFMISANSDECMRRAQHRKVDSTTGNVYHMQDNKPPEDPKLIERLQNFFGGFPNEDDMIAKIDHNHMQFSDNENYLRRFYSEFGVIDQQAGKGIASFNDVIIDQITMKDAVFESVGAHIDKILDFKQIAQDRAYKNLKAIIAAEEDAAQKLAEEGSAAHNAQASIQNSQEQIAKATLNKDSIDVMSESDKHPHQAVLINNLSKTQSDLKGDKMNQSIMSNRGPGSTSSLPKAGKGGKKIDYTPQYKIKLWEEMVVTYLRKGMLTMNEINKQHESITDQLNFCQSQFIQFLERPDNKEEKVEEFVNSFNQFAAEFPELRQDDQTKEELLARVETLSNNLWANIEARKDESLAEISKQQEEGWSVLEMKQLCKNIANLIEIEISKFVCIYQILKEEEPEIELDAEIMTRKMIERGVKPYEPKTKKSPILEQVVVSLVGKMEDLFEQADLQNDSILSQERKVFTYRLAMINAWGLAILEEISYNAQQVYNLMDDWIVEAVAQENKQISQVLKYLTDIVKSDKTRINDYTRIGRVSLYNSIRQMQFNIGQTPLYLQHIHTPHRDLNCCRFTAHNLEHIYKEIRHNTGDRGSYDTLDQQAFLNIMQLAFRQGRVPLVWKYMNFDKITELCQMYSETPLPALTVGNETPTQYQSQLNASMGKNFKEQANVRSWINWKKVMTSFALLNTQIPTEDQLNHYKEALTNGSFDNDQNHISLENFLKTPAWFDRFEGKPDAALLNLWIEENRRKAMEDSDIDSDEDESGNVEGRLDTERLTGMKSILFNVHRVKTGENKLSIPQLMDRLSELSSGLQNNLTFSQAIFGQ